jgi:hypothetical protein
MVKTGVMLIVVIIAHIAFADIAIDFSNSQGFLEHSGTSGSPTAETILEQGVLVQLIWAPTTNSYRSGWWKPGISPIEEILIGDGNTTLPSGIFDFGRVLIDSTDTGGIDPHTGYVYARVADNNAPFVGDWYTDFGILSPTTPYDPNDPASVYGLINDRGNYQALDMTIPIPEPSTLGLFCIFGASMFLLRNKTEKTNR